MVLEQMRLSPSHHVIAWLAVGIGAEGRKLHITIVQRGGDIDGTRAQIPVGG